MICPFRTGVNFETEEVGNKIVIRSQEEYYPECYQEDCPYYQFPNGCGIVEKELN